MLLPPSLFLSLLLAIFLLLITTIRILSILPSFSRPPQRRKRGSGPPTHLLIVLGSGGHTAEMLSLLAGLDTRSYNHRTYVISGGDAFSAGKAVDFERGLQRARRRRKSKDNWVDSTKEEDEKKEVGFRENIEENDSTAEQDKEHGSYDIRTIPRARQIHQPLLTTPLSSLHCLYACISLLSSSAFESYPDLILANGPGTAVILILASLLIKFFALPHHSPNHTNQHHYYHPGVNASLGNSPSSANSPSPKGKMRSIYVESWARVKTMSLSGRILVALGMCDRVLVQWEGLNGKGREFRGVLVR